MYSESVLIPISWVGTFKSMARRGKSGDYSYSQTARIRGHENDGRYAVIQIDRDQSRVAPRRPDGTAIGPGMLVRTADLFDLKRTQIVPTAQRGTITLPGDFRRDLGIEQGTPLEITLEVDGRLSILPLRRMPTAGPAADLDDLLGRITPENVHGEVSTGEAVGRESW
jgi:antitoxin MazE